MSLPVVLHLSLGRLAGIDGMLDTLSLVRAAVNLYLIRLAYVFLGWSQQGFASPPGACRGANGLTVSARAYKSSRVRGL